MYWLFLNANIKVTLGKNFRYLISFGGQVTIELNVYKNVLIIKNEVKNGYLTKFMSFTSFGFFLCFRGRAPPPYSLQFEMDMEDKDEE